MRLKFAIFAFCLMFAQLATAQAAPNAIGNTDVISMTKAGIGEHTIILAIQRGPVKFDTSPQALIALKRAGVSDQVLNAIISVRTSPEESAQESISTGEPRPECVPKPAETSVASSVRASCCEKDFASSCSNLAHFYETGTQGLPKDPSITNALKVRACEKGAKEDCSFRISDASERMAFEEAAALTDPAAQVTRLETFLQLYPQSVERADVLQMLAEAKRQVATNEAPPQTPSANITHWPAQTTSQGLTLRVLQEQSVPYVREMGGGLSTSCNITGSANTSAYVNAYGNSAYGNATTNSNQHMRCSSYDTTMRWPHVLNVMFVQASDGNSYIIGCDRAWAWSKCSPLRAGETFNARFTGRGIEVEAINSKGKEENLTYNVLQSRASR